MIKCNVKIEECFNRWSKIAEHLPGRTDNEIKNYWRTRVIKQARQLKCDVNSKQFRDALRYVWMPRLLERVQPTLQPNNQLDQSPNGAQDVLHCSESSSGAKPIHTDSSSVELQVPSNSNHSGKGWDLWPSFNGGGESLESLWNDESVWFLQQLCDDHEMK
ncbi:hypothetical protein RJT34_23176 [Clitoria ternatea]|uniref:Uncharacterized protein n=1 Tax=Clitoria ternatea TaxID=43366 RepID=A0AAN9FNC4_CLITE